MVIIHSKINKLSTIHTKLYISCFHLFAYFTLQQIDPSVAKRPLLGPPFLAQSEKELRYQILAFVLQLSFSRSLIDLLEVTC